MESKENNLSGHETNGRNALENTLDEKRLNRNS